MARFHMLLIVGLLWAMLPGNTPVTAAPSAYPTDLTGPFATRSWGMGSQQVFYASNAECNIPTFVYRAATTGGNTRPILYKSASGCNAYEVRSNLATDNEFVYWMDATGLVRQPVGAASSEPPVIMNPNYRDDASFHSLTLLGDQVYAASGRSIWHSSKTWLDGGELVTTMPYSASSITSDGASVFFLSGGNLYEFSPGSVPNPNLPLASGVSSYYAEGLRSPLFGQPTRPYVFYATQGSTGIPATIRRLDMITGANTLVYTATPAAGTVSQIEGITTDFAAFNSRLFFAERNTETCGSFVCDSALVLQRSTLSGGSRAVMYTTNNQSNDVFDGLRYQENAIFYRYTNRLFRLDANAEEPSSINLRAAAGDHPGHSEER